MRTISFSLALLLLPLAAVAQTQSGSPADVPNTPSYSVDDSHALTAEGLGWKLTDKATGKERNLLLPAFHPEQSHPVIDGQHLAYISLTKHGERQQLGCVTFDLTKGKVVNRKDSTLFGREGEPLSAPTLGEDGAVTCHLKGDQCNAKGGACSAAEEDVALNFVPGAVAGKPLKSKSAKGGKSGKGHHGAHGSHAPSKKAAAHKSSHSAKTKHTAKKAKHS
ncbi:MAG TPA: hypothetical protein VFW68_12085 [Rhodocyclaceae bacterium]|nr:hypothetical protein [Rhodocyclaceae bacterium]